ncbi:MAG: ATP-binding protein [Anaerolineales bacterium]
MESVSFQIPAGYGKIRAASEALRDLLLRHQVESAIVDGCELALHELLANIIGHSYNGDESRRIEVRLRVERTRFFAETEDDGTPANLDLTKVCMPDPKELPVGGYGVPVIKMLMDKVEYQHNDGKNTWLLAKAI